MISTGKSKCCGAMCYVVGNTTHYYLCDKCGKPCDVDYERKEGVV